MNKFTLVLGASEKTERYSNMAIRKLRAHGHDVAAIGNRTGQVGDVSFSKDQKALKGIDTVTLYLGKKHQIEYYNYILSLKPKRIIFNPGAENEELSALAANEGIQTLEACTLVMLGTGQY